MSIEKYSLVLEKLAEHSQTQQELEEYVKGFCLWLEKKNASHLARKIFRKFEEDWIKKNRLSQVQVEFAKDFSVNNQFRKMLVEKVPKGSRGVILKEKINSDLIAGVRVWYNNAYLVDVSFRGILSQLFS